jgi:hypothetical protein
MANVKLWMRLGTTLTVSAEQAEKILSGDFEALDAVLKTAGAWEFDGDSYIPGEIVDELRTELGLCPVKFHGDVNFDL